MFRNLKQANINRHSQKAIVTPASVELIRKLIRREALTTYVNQKLPLPTAIIINKKFK